MEFIRKRERGRPAYVISHTDGRGPNVFPIIDTTRADWHRPVLDKIEQLDPWVVHFQHEYGLYRHTDEHGASDNNAGFLKLVERLQEQPQQVLEQQVEQVQVVQVAPQVVLPVQRVQEQLVQQGQAREPVELLRVVVLEEEQDLQQVVPLVVVRPVEVQQQVVEEPVQDLVEAVVLAGVVEVEGLNPPVSVIY